MEIRYTNADKQTIRVFLAPGGHSRDLPATFDGVHPNPGDLVVSESSSPAYLEGTTLWTFRYFRYERILTEDEAVLLDQAAGFLEKLNIDINGVLLSNPRRSI